MDVRVRSLLYDEPRLYDLVFPDPGDTMGRMCREAFARYLSAPPASVVDIGCGTGRLLESLAATVGECWGVDYAESNVVYAQSTRPRLIVRQGDMRTVRLGRCFDVVTCFGNALSYALTDGDLGCTAETFAAHTHSGSLLMVDALNARCYLVGDGFRERIDGSVDTPEFRATSVSTHSLDRSARLLRRTRVWSIPGREEVKDYAEYRLLYPEELRGFLEAAGFEILGMYDNREFRVTALTGHPADARDAGGMGGRKLYTFAVKL